MAPGRGAPVCRVSREADPTVPQATQTSLKTSSRATGSQGLPLKTRETQAAPASWRPAALPPAGFLGACVLRSPGLTAFALPRLPTPEDRRGRAAQCCELPGPGRRRDCRSRWDSAGPAAPGQRCEPPRWGRQPAGSRSPGFGSGPDVGRLLPPPQVTAAAPREPGDKTTHTAGVTSGGFISFSCNWHLQPSKVVPTWIIAKRKGYFYTTYRNIGQSQCVLFHLEIKRKTAIGDPTTVHLTAVIRKRFISQPA